MAKESRPPDFARTPPILAPALPRQTKQHGSSPGYDAVRFGASLVRADLEDVPDLPLPEGVELRAVTPEMLRPIFDAHREAFRGDWDFTEATEEDFQISSTTRCATSRCGRSHGPATWWSAR